MHEKNRRVSVNSLLFIPWTFLLCIGIRNVARKSRDEITVFENHRKKVSFKITSEARFVYIFSGQKLIKKAKIVHFGNFLNI